MRARQKLTDLVKQYDESGPFNSAMDAADMLTEFVAVSREVIGEFRELYTAEGDQAWEAWDDDDGTTYVEFNGAGGPQLVLVDRIRAWSGKPHGGVYKVLRAIYGGDPD